MKLIVNIPQSHRRAHAKNKECFHFQISIKETIFDSQEVYGEHFERSLQQNLNFFWSLTAYEHS